jgi:hypothetical protein
MVGIRLSGTVARESNGEINARGDDRVTDEILGGVPASLSEKKGNARFCISGWSGSAFFPCNAIRRAWRLSPRAVTPAG